MRAIDFSKDAHKALAKLQKSSPKTAKAIAHKIIELRSVGITSNCTQLRKSSPPLFRLRCGDYRIIFEISKTRLDVLAIGHRKDIYTKSKHRNLI